MSELIYKKVNEVFKHADGNCYQCVEGVGCRNCAFWGTGYCGKYACGEPSRPDRIPVKFVAVSDESIESMKEKDTAEPSRHIELGVVKVEGDYVLFQIVEQTHRQEAFSQQGVYCFKAANGFELASIDGPGLTDSNKLFCRGNLCDSDNVGLVCTVSQFARISEAVFEYNCTNGKGYEEPWPQKGDKYFYITACGDVSHCVFNGYNFDLDTQRFGNFFRTEQEVSVARDKVQTLLKGLNFTKKAGSDA